MPTSDDRQPDPTPEPRIAPPAEASFAETALKLGGKSDEEVRRTGAIDKADEQVEVAVRRAVSNRPKPGPSGRLGSAICRSNCSARNRRRRRRKSIA